MGHAAGLVESIRKVCAVGRAGGHYWRERYGETGGYGAHKYREYPANLICIVQRFLFGVDLRLDGALVFSPSSSCVRAYEDGRIIVNMSVWKSVQALHNYVYATAHAKVFRNRRRWFKAMGAQVVALWWTPAGSIPTIADGRARF